MKRFLTVLVLSFAGIVSAQPNPNPRYVEFKYLRQERADKAISFVRQVMGGRVNLIWEPSLNQLAIVGTNADQITQAESLLRNFDRPQAQSVRKALDFTIYLIAAYSDDPTSAETTNEDVRILSRLFPVTRAGQIPAELASVAKEMKSSFAYKNLALLDTIPVQATENTKGTEYSGILPSRPGTKFFYKVNIEGPGVLEDGKTVSVYSFGFTVDVPSFATGAKVGESGIRTTLTIKEGQKVVLGKIRLDERDNSGVFLVVAVKVL